MNKPAAFGAALGAAILVIANWSASATAQQTPTMNTQQTPTTTTPQAPPTGAQQPPDSNSAQQPSNDKGEQNPNTLTGCRNARYGEVLVVKGPVSKLRAIIYNTIGIGDCPQNLWEKLDGGSIKKQEHAFGARLDGPRHYVVDSIGFPDMDDSQADDLKTYGGIRMRKVAQIKLNPSTAQEKLQTEPYGETTVAWNTEYVFRQRRPMYELTSPKGQVYVMLSYAQSVDHTLTMDQLAHLASRLKLPPGWQYRVVTPDYDFVLPKSKKGVNALQDDLLNTYQRLDAAADGASSPAP